MPRTATGPDRQPGAIDLRDVSRVLASSLGLAKPPELTIQSQHVTLLNRVYRVRMSGTQPPSDFFVKVMGPEGEPEDLRREAENTRTFRALFADTHATLDSAELVAFCANKHSLIVRACPGRSLFDEIHASCRWLSPGSAIPRALAHARAAGRWVQYVERVSAGSADPAAVHRQFILAAEEARERIREMGVFTRYSSLVDECVNAVLTMDEGRPLQTCATHGDVHPENLFITDDATPLVTAIDLGNAAPRVAGYDALFFEHSLRHSFPIARFVPKRLARVLESFWEGYGGKPAQMPATRGVRAHLMLASLVYQSTLARKASFPRKLYCLLDGAILKRSFVAAQPRSS
jgi:Ser/Thr protein kinase RdoA (MazF antagonist)